MPLPTDLPITEEDWNQTPPAVQAVVITLWQQVQTLQTQVATLQAEVAQLREQVGRNSQNSSQPPSADAPSAPPRPQRPPSGRKPGGQPGHRGHGRKLISVEQVQNLIDLKPTTCDHCGALLLGEDTRPVRHQVTELPRVEPEVTEYRQHTLTCLACGTQTQAELPTEIPSGSFGPRLQALVSYLTDADERRRSGAARSDFVRWLDRGGGLPLDVGRAGRARACRASTGYSTGDGHVWRGAPLGI
jgi:transposase